MTPQCARRAAWAATELARVTGKEYVSWRAVELSWRLCRVLREGNTHSLLKDVSCLFPMLSHRDWKVQRSAAVCLVKRLRGSKEVQRTLPDPQLFALARSDDLDAWSRLVVWYVILSHLDSECSTKKMRAKINKKLKRSAGAFESFCEDIFAFLFDKSLLMERSNGMFSAIVKDIDLEAVEPQKGSSRAVFAARLWFLVLKRMRMRGRKWWMSLRDVQLYDFVRDFTVAYVTPQVVARELQQADEYTHPKPNIIITASFQKKAVKVTFEEDDSVIGVSVSMPKGYPLSPAVLDRTGEVMMMEDVTFLKWCMFVQNSTSSVLEASLRWTDSMVSYFAGVESCYICYCTFHPQRGTLPKIQCFNCKYGFHGACIKKWFDSAPELVCPLCQVEWDWRSMRRK